MAASLTHNSWRIYLRSVPGQHVRPDGGRHQLHGLPHGQHQLRWLHCMHLHRRLLDVRLGRLARLHRYVEASLQRRLIAATHPSIVFFRFFRDFIHSACSAGTYSPSGVSCSSTPAFLRPSFLPRIHGLTPVLAGSAPPRVFLRARFSLHRLPCWLVQPGPGQPVHAVPEQQRQLRVRRNLHVQRRLLWQRHRPVARLHQYVTKPRIHAFCITWPSPSPPFVSGARMCIQSARATRTARLRVRHPAQRALPAAPATPAPPAARARLAFRALAAASPWHAQVPCSPGPTVPRSPTNASCGGSAGRVCSVLCGLLQRLRHHLPGYASASRPLRLLWFIYA